MPVEGRPTRIHALLGMIYENGGAMVLPNYGMADEQQLDRLPNRGTVDEYGFGFDELMELTSLAKQAGLMEGVVDLEEQRAVGDGGEVDTQPVTTLYALTAQGTAVARERAEAANHAVFADRMEDAVERAVERAVEGAVEARDDRDPVTVEIDAGEIADHIEWPDPPDADEEDEEPDEGPKETAGPDAAADAAAAPARQPAIDGAVLADAARAVTVFAAALVLVASADAARGLLRDALPGNDAVITAGLLALYAVVLIFVVRTTFEVGRSAEQAGDDASDPEADEDGASDEEATDDGDDDDGAGGDGDTEAEDGDEDGDGGEDED